MEVHRSRQAPSRRGPIRGGYALMAVGAFLCFSHLSFLITVMSNKSVMNTPMNSDTSVVVQRFESIEQRVGRRAKFKERLSLEERLDALENKMNERDNITAVLYEQLALAEKSIQSLNNTIRKSNGDDNLLATLLRDAGLTDLDTSTLPHWDTITDMYGSDVVIKGMDTCRAFRDTIPKIERRLGVAGLFNTGTNLLAQYLQKNCKIPGARGKGGILWQVPWGKHMLPTQKWNNTAKRHGDENKTATMPVTLIRDPYNWLHSMCDHQYAIYWPHSKIRCPNLIGNKKDKKRFRGKPVPVKIRYRRDFQVKFPSLAHVWSEYYSQYNEVDYPRLLVRYEDMMFQPKQVVEQVCKCVGGKMKSKEFIYHVDNSKANGKGHGVQRKEHGLFTSVLKNGDPSRRVEGFTADDLAYSYTALDKDLMDLFHYSRPTDDGLDVSVYDSEDSEDDPEGSDSSDDSVDGDGDSEESEDEGSGDSDSSDEDDGDDEEDSDESDGDTESRNDSEQSDGEDGENSGDNSSDSGEESETDDSGDSTDEKEHKKVAETLLDKNEKAKKRPIDSKRLRAKTKRRKKKV